MCSHSILECCVTFSGVKLSIRSFVLLLTGLLGSVLEIQSLYFYPQPWQAQAIRKRSDFVFPGTDRVIRQVNRKK